MRNTKQARRTFLRGAGVTMALPWLESLSGFGIPSASAATPPSPQRFAVLFMGTGISPGRWWAKGEGAGMELSESLAPLEPLKTKVNVIDGLFNKAATGQGIHPAMTGNLLSGVPIRKGSIIQGGITAIEPDGKYEHTPFPDLIVTNICFGGKDMRDAYITLSSSSKLIKARWPRPGHKLNFAQY